MQTRAAIAMISPPLPTQIILSHAKTPNNVYPKHRSAHGRADAGLLTPDRANADLSTNNLRTTAIYPRQPGQQRPQAERLRIKREPNYPNSAFLEKGYPLHQANPGR